MPITNRNDRPTIVLRRQEPDIEALLERYPVDHLMVPYFHADEATDRATSGIGVSTSPPSTECRPG